MGLESWFTLAPAASRASIAVRFPLEEACMRGVHPFSRHVASRSASSFREADRVLCTYIHIYIQKNKEALCNTKKTHAKIDQTKKKRMLVCKPEKSRRRFAPFEPSSTRGNLTRA